MGAWVSVRNFWGQTLGEVYKRRFEDVVSRNYVMFNKRSQRQLSVEQRSCLENKEILDAALKC